MAEGNADGVGALLRGAFRQITPRGLDLVRSINGGVWRPGSTGLTGSADTEAGAGLLIHNRQFLPQISEHKAVWSNIHPRTIFPPASIKQSTYIIALVVFSVIPHNLPPAIVSNITCFYSNHNHIRVMRCQLLLLRHFRFVIRHQYARG